MRKGKRSWLPKGSGNLFQEIKAKCKEAEEKGVKLWKLSIGQPTGPALLSARKAASVAILSEKESMHEYQDNGSPGVDDFARRFIQLHVYVSLYDNQYEFDFLPTPGTKSMLGLIPMACGGVEGKQIVVGTMTNPGYPTPKIWCGLTNQAHCSLVTNSENEFRFNAKYIDMQGRKVDLLMLNYPHNPSGQIATIEQWREICEYCQSKGIRLFNDAAYAYLWHSKESTTLTDVAHEFPNLSWAEAFSASKLIGNGTAWRIGAMAGSPDFIGDIKRIKGETDSGFNAALATGVLAALYEDSQSIKDIRDFYENNVKHLVEIISARGMVLAVMPGAGFFTLWMTPRRAFGQKIENAKHFNYLMIEKTGIVGVHFDPYIRYAGVGPVRNADFTKAIEEGFKAAEVSY
jgi:aspartate/methionine/tyrosine aminotransferase